MLWEGGGEEEGYLQEWNESKETLCEWLVRVLQFREEFLVHFKQHAELLRENGIYDFGGQLKSAGLAEQRIQEGLVKWDSERVSDGEGVVDRLLRVTSTMNCKFSM